MGENIRNLDIDSFDTTLRKTEKLVVVQFYTSTCAECKAVAPVYEEISGEMGENAEFAKMDAQENMSIAIQYGIMATPTFKFFCGGRPAGEIVGAVNATLLRNTIKDMIRHRHECSKSTKLVYEIDGYG
jgi:thioredoxin-like negative regulator of GroEL